MLNPVPKPNRAARLEQHQSRLRVRQERQQRVNQRRRMQEYGVQSGGDPWPVVKARVLARDGYRCVMPCQTPRLGLQVHHLVSVGAGGASVDSNLVTVCAWCHQDVHDGRLSRARLKAQMADRGLTPLPHGTHGTHGTQED